MRHVTHSKLMWYTHQPVMAHTRISHGTHRQESWHTWSGVMTHFYVCYDSFLWVPWLIPMCAMTHFYVCRESFVCVPWLIRQCDMSRVQRPFHHERVMAHIEWRCAPPLLHWWLLCLYVAVSLCEAHRHIFITNESWHTLTANMYTHSSRTEPWHTLCTGVYTHRLDVMYALIYHEWVMGHIAWWCAPLLSFINSLCLSQRSTLYHTESIFYSLYFLS